MGEPTRRLVAPQLPKPMARGTSTNRPEHPGPGPPRAGEVVAEVSSASRAERDVGTRGSRSREWGERCRGSSARRPQRRSASARRFSQSGCSPTRRWSRSPVAPCGAARVAAEARRHGAMERHGAMRFSTRATLRREAAILEEVDAGRDAHAAVVDELTVDQVLADPPLGGTSARQCAGLLTGWRARRCFSSVRRARGTSRALDGPRRAWQAAGYDPIGLAPSAMAAQVLNREAVCPIRKPLAKFLYEARARHLADDPRPPQRRDPRRDRDGSHRRPREAPCRRSSRADAEARVGRGPTPARRGRTRWIFPHACRRSRRARAGKPCGVSTTPWEAAASLRLREGNRRSSPPTSATTGIASGSANR